jgi:hypothetical protein
VSRRRVLEAAFVLLEFSSPSRRIFIGSHSLPPSLVRRIGPSVSDPLGKGNGSTHPRQNYAQAKSTNHQTKARKPQRAPPAHMQAPPEPMQLPLDECMKTT